MLTNKEIWLVKTFINKSIPKKFKNFVKVNKT